MLLVLPVRAVGMDKVQRAGAKLHGAVLEQVGEAELLKGGVRD